MKTVELISNGGHQTVQFPDEFRFTESIVSIRKAGDALILEQVKSGTWPPNFFEAIHIQDSAFMRPPQGEAPSVRFPGS